MPEYSYMPDAVPLATNHLSFVVSMGALLCPGLLERGCACRVCLCQETT